MEYYKKKIIKLLDRIESEEVMCRIYCYIHRIYADWILSKK